MSYEQTDGGRIVYVRAKAFSGERVREHKMLVQGEDGPVLVWDSVARYLSSCHTLSARAIRCARRAAYQR